jgi:membrane protease YdiL (CAAX protease family)
LGRFRTHLKTAPAVILSSLFYASYHLITTANLFSMRVGILFTIVICFAGVFWATIRAKSGSLYGSIASHFLADAAVMIIYVVFIQQHL